ncbi:hypothetical protein Pelo_15884 [Pelomyxa schiedti]|nr:hypothetical protein Pelo_15884 [Pelomyxa schiedti]
MQGLHIIRIPPLPTGSYPLIVFTIAPGAYFGEECPLLNATVTVIAAKEGTAAKPSVGEDVVVKYFDNSKPNLVDPAPKKSIAWGSTFDCVISVISGVGSPKHKVGAYISKKFAPPTTTATTSASSSDNQNQQPQNSAKAKEDQVTVLNEAWESFSVDLAVVPTMPPCTKLFMISCIEMPAPPKPEDGVVSASLSVSVSQEKGGYWSLDAIPITTNTPTPNPSS